MTLSPDTSAVERHYAEAWDRLGRVRSVEPMHLPRRGRRRRALFVVRVTEGALFRRLDRIRAAVAAFPGLVPVPDHFLHVPVFDAGGVVLGGRPSGDHRLDELAGLAERAGEILGGIRPVNLDFARVNVAGGEVFAEVHPPEPLVALADALRPLRRGCVHEALPRLPLARVVAPTDAARLVQALEWFRDRPIGRLHVGALLLAVVRSDRRYAGFHRIAEPRLGDRSARG